jgi:FixJ family two-component response regulator
MSEPIRVLQVDNDTEVMAALRLLLKSAGFALSCATGAQEAIRSITVDGFCPEVLLLDYALSDEETGADLAEHIAHVLHHRVPTIILSGQLFNAEVPWMPGTPLMLVSKPMDGEALIATISLFGAWQRQALARATGTAYFA